jgi:hypothetical protein
MAEVHEVIHLHDDENTRMVTAYRVDLTRGEREFIESLGLGTIEEFLQVMVIKELHGLGYKAIPRGVAK